MSSVLPRIAVTSGDPAGIGPDLCIMLAQHKFNAEIVMLGNAELFRDRAKQLGINIECRTFNPQSLQPPQPHETGVLNVLPIELNAEVVCGKPSAQHASYVLNTLRAATEGCLNGLFDAVTTPPISKAIINDAGVPFMGHTEYFAELCGASLPVMMLATEGLRVALVTTHIPITQVPSEITSSRLSQTIEILHHDLQKWFSLKHPNILVCGLNPHAGENGHIGTEDRDVIAPTIRHYREQGLNISGPYPADTVFTPKHMAHADAILTMYHDQGLPVIKHMGFGKTVNITLGLPMLRTSVDHGTAFDLAGTGAIDAGSMKAALQLAIDCCHGS